LIVRRRRRDDSVPDAADPLRIRPRLGGRQGVRPPLPAGACAWSVIGVSGSWRSLPSTRPTRYGATDLRRGLMSDPFFWGASTRTGGLTKPEYMGTLSGLSAACQVGVGYLLVSFSGPGCALASAAGALRNIWLVGGAIFLLAAVRVLALKSAPLERRRACDHASCTARQFQFLILAIAVRFRRSRTQRLV